MRDQTWIFISLKQALENYKHDQELYKKYNELLEIKQSDVNIEFIRIESQLLNEHLSYLRERLNELPLEDRILLYDAYMNDCYEKLCDVMSAHDMAVGTGYRRLLKALRAYSEIEEWQIVMKT